ncbi:MAG: ThiF family adenylyltransferase [Dehalococcoidia bacterium]|nr:ThiF family adenylyltransferase [Dehalococcoidia bacterium]
MARIATLHLAGLERFQSELVAADFRPLDTDLRLWQGPLLACFRSLTGATTMRIRLRDGWPYAWPQVFVDGLTGSHVNAYGEVCLWQPTEDSITWLTFEELKLRLEAWCERVRRGFTAADAALDSHLYFRETLPRILATFDLGALGPAGGFADGANGVLRAVSAHHNLLRRLIPETEAVGAVKLEDDWRGRWFFRESLQFIPRTLDEFRATLTANQRARFDGELMGIVNIQRRPAVAMLVHRTTRSFDVLVIHVERVDGIVRARAIEAAPSDRQSLLLRAGPDAEALATKRVVLFGAGAVGSHAALLLAASGLGVLNVFDAESLRPGNVVRHLGSNLDVGLSKGQVVATRLRASAPWTVIRSSSTSPWSPDELRKVADADLIVEATGNARFAAQLSIVAQEAQVAMASVALYRSGTVARVRLQPASTEIPIYMRETRFGFPEIPPGHDEPAGLEIGCSAPVVNAAPASVMAAAASVSMLAIEAMTARETSDLDIVDVWSPADVAPFHEVGRRRFPDR